MKANAESGTMNTLPQVVSITFAALLLSASAAFADSIPRYDVAAYCKQIGDVAGGSSMIEQACMEQEQQAYNALKATWSAIPKKARNYCDEIARTAGGTYQIMGACIQQETNASEAIPEFEY